MTSTSISIAVNLVADSLCGGHAPNVIRCLCVWCLENIDPAGELAPIRAPDSAECVRCGNPARERDGLIFVAIPRDHRIPEWKGV